jgi:hypothetical protein
MVSTTTLMMIPPSARLPMPTSMVLLLHSGLSLRRRLPFQLTLLCPALLLLTLPPFSLHSNLLMRSNASVRS